MTRHVFAVSVSLICFACNTPEAERTWLPTDHPGFAERQAVNQPQVASAGQTLFGALCASCHGSRGNGHGANGLPPVAPRPISFASTDFQSTRTDQQIAMIITAGRGGFMPAFGDRLTPTQVNELVLVIRQMAPAESGIQPAAQTP